MQTNTNEFCQFSITDFTPPNQANLAIIGAAFVAGMKSGRSGASEIISPAGNHEPVTPECIHKIPSIPVVLDGKRTTPESVKDFDGKPLYYILDDMARDGEALQVFSDTTKATRAILTKNSKAQTRTSVEQQNIQSISIDTNSSPQQIAEAIGGAVFLWEHINFSGAQWRFNAGTTGYPQHTAGDGNIRDFRSVFCFLWWCQNINDRVSSVSNLSEVWAYLRPRRSFVVLHQHINFQGAQLWIPERASFPDLSQFGWNDVASSLSYVLI